MSVNPRVTSTTYQNQNQSLTITYTYDEGQNAKGKLTSITKMGLGDEPNPTKKSCKY